MWVSSFVITVPAEPERVECILNALRAVPVFEIGEIVGCRLPVVLEAEDGSSARHWHHWVEELPGVIHVDVAFVSFDDDEDSAASEPVDAHTTPTTEIR